MSLNSRTAAQFPPFSSEPFSLPTSTPSGPRGKSLMKGWKSHFFKEGKFLGKKIELQHILSLLIKYMPVWDFRQMQINLLLLCPAQMCTSLAFAAPGLCNAGRGSQAWGTHGWIASMYFTVPLWKTGWDLQVWVIPLPRAGNLSLVPRRAASCCWPSPPADGCWRRLVSMLTLTALLQDLPPWKSIRLKRRNSSGDESSGIPAGPLKPPDVLPWLSGAQEWGFSHGRLSIEAPLHCGDCCCSCPGSVAVGRSPAPSPSGGRPRGRLCRLLRGPVQPDGCPIEAGRRAVSSPSISSTFSGRSESPCGKLCPGGRCSPNFYPERHLPPVPFQCFWNSKGLMFSWFTLASNPSIISLIPWPQDIHWQWVPRVNRLLYSFGGADLNLYLFPSQSTSLTFWPSMGMGQHLPRNGLQYFKSFQDDSCGWEAP